MSDDAVYPEPIVGVTSRRVVLFALPFLALMIALGIALAPEPVGWAMLAIAAIPTYMAVYSFFKPGTLRLDEHGFHTTAFGRTQSWSWEGTSNFRLPPPGRIFVFDAEKSEIDSFGKRFSRVLNFGNQSLNNYGFGSRQMLQLMRDYQVAALADR